MGKRVRASSSSEEPCAKLRYLIHKVKFFKPAPKAITVMAYDHVVEKLAVVRSDFSIEIWNFKFTPCVEGVILGNPNNSVEAAAWHNGRLFTTGLHGRIVEYDLVSFEQKYSVAVTSGAAWCLAEDCQKTRLAAGTEDGRVCIYEVTEDSLNFHKMLNKQESRIMCLAWSKDGNIIVSGSPGAIVIWDVNTGRAVDRISVGRIEKNQEVLVLCLAVTSDFTIITGDSCGRTSFWDGPTATLISSFRAHNADVLALCLSEGEKDVFVAGVDPLLVKFTRIGHTQKWAKSMQKTCHKLDVKALALAKGQLLSGGCDTSLAVSTETSLVTHCPFQFSSVQVAASSGCILLNYGEHLELWRLDCTTSKEGPCKTSTPCSKPELLVRVKARNGATYHTAAVSHDHCWLACSDAGKARLYQVSEVNGSSLDCNKVSTFNEQMGPAKKLMFSPDGSYLVALSSHGSVHVFSLPPRLLYTLPSRAGGTMYPHMVCVSLKHLAVADNEGIHIYDLKTSEVLCNLPEAPCLPTAMRFNPKSGDLLVIYSNNQVVEYDVDSESSNQWCQVAYQHGGLTLETTKPLTGIAFDSRNADIFFAYSDQELLIVDKAKALRKGIRSNAVRKKKFQWLTLFDQVQDEMLVVEVPPEQLVGLPPPLWKKKYGT
ncbi:U3 small nucleolar RNA-associated protein 4 homolog [Dermacentor variabilis]|uniref:U3 small nucleolar RNA-associated protein 4 homolog n=1 Tax=Dermacentor variabilis TaxID=34621 RepID=UPI003F5AFE80